MFTNWFFGMMIYITITFLWLETPYWIFTSDHFNNILYHDKIKSSLFTRFKSLIYSFLQCQYKIFLNYAKYLNFTSTVRACSTIANFLNYLLHYNQFVTPLLPSYCIYWGKMPITFIILFRKYLFAWELPWWLRQ